MCLSVMSIRISIRLICVLNVALSIYAVNHWVLNDNGKVLQKIDSPFYMREPNNLIAFLDQIKHNEIVETTYLELLRQRELMAELIYNSIQFGMEVIEQAKCAIEYYEIEKSLTSTKLTTKYLNRLGLKTKTDLQKENNLPFCWQYVNINEGICCFAHLQCLANTNLLYIEPEEELEDAELELNTDNFLSTIINGLETNPENWKYHTLGSYYWRMKGDAHQAVECAKRGFLLAPRDARDIPLLSLGTILWRSVRLKEAEIVLTAAVDHAPDVPENHFALGITLAILNDYNRSIEHFQQAEKLDSNFIPKTKSLNDFFLCIENLNKKSAKMQSYEEYIKKEVNGLKLMKNRITQSHEKLIQQQVPLGARYFDVEASNEELLHRGQYCSTRTLAGTDEPVLFCDFYSELQMRLESKEVDIESLERELNANSEAFLKKLSEFHTQFGFDKLRRKSSRDV